MQRWEVFSTEIPPRLERCDPRTNGGLPYRTAPDPEVADPLRLCGRTSQLDWMCRQLAGSPTEHDRLYFRTDLVRVWEHYGFRRAQTIADRLAEAQMIVRSTQG